MTQNKILLTTPTYPYPTLPANDSLTDATGQRFTKGDNLFSLISHTHCFANHILAQNVKVPSVLLEYPRWQDFTREIDKGYPAVKQVNVVENSLTTPGRTGWRQIVFSGGGELEYLRV